MGVVKYKAQTPVMYAQSPSQVFILVFYYAQPLSDYLALIDADVKSKMSWESDFMSIFAIFPNPRSPNLTHAQKSHRSLPSHHQ